MIARALISLFTALCLAVGAAIAEVSVVSETGDADLISDIRSELVAGAAPETVFEARRQARRAAERSEAYLNSRGYFAADISHSVTAGPPIQAMIKVEPGPQFSIGSVDIDLNGTILSDQDTARFERALKLQPGDLARPDQILAQEGSLIAALQSYGYGDAEAMQRQTLGDLEAATIDIVFRLNPGARLRFGSVRFPSDTRTRRDYLDRLVPFAEGEIFLPEHLSTLNRRLSSTRLYALSSAQLDAETSTITPDGDEIRDVVVTLSERDRYTLTAGASVSSSEGGGLTTELARRNATRRGDTLTGSLTLAEQQQGIGAEWRIPNMFGYDRSFELAADATHETTDAYNRDAVTAIGSVEIRESRRLTYALSAGSEFTSETDSLGQRDLQILSVSGGARWDYSDDPLDPTQGWRADVRAEPALAVGDTESRFFTLNSQLTGYLPISGEKLIAAARVRNAFVYGASLDELPVSHRFFAGGGGSARGFAYQSVGPKDADNNPIGGRGLLEFSGELRWRGTGNLGYVAFLDGAEVSSDQAPQFEDLRYSAGLGVRYNTVVGPIRFDIATPIDRETGDDPVQFYVSIGQAF